MIDNVLYQFCLLLFNNTKVICDFGVQKFINEDNDRKFAFNALIAMSDD